MQVLRCGAGGSRLEGDVLEGERERVAGVFLGRSAVVWCRPRVFFSRPLSFFLPFGWWVGFYIAVAMLFVTSGVTSVRTCWEALLNMAP